jgi:hypothetical protein
MQRITSAKRDSAPSAASRRRKFESDWRMPEMLSTCRNRRTLRVALGLVASLAAGPSSLGQDSGSETVIETASVDCSAWSLNGYRLGMPLEEARALRETKAGQSRPGAGQATFTVKEEGRMAGTLIFDAGTRLVAWSTVYLGADPDEIRTALIGRLGPPVLDDRVGTDGKTRFGDEYRRLVTAWRSEACGAGVVLAISTATQNEEVTSVRVSLVAAAEVGREIAEVAAMVQTSEEAERYLD